MSKMLDKVSKLLAKAENEGATPAEREIFMAKAVELATINSIELAVARMHQAKKEKVEEPEERRIQVNPYNRRHNRKHFVDLGLAIAEVNDVRCLIGGNDYTLICIGFPSDIDVVESLYTHLAVEMVSECDEALKKGVNKAVEKVALTRRVPLAWEDREWGRWNGKQYYDENPDDEVYCYQRSEETEAEYEVRLVKVTEEARKEYLEAVANGTRLYSPNSRNGEGGYRKPVPPPDYREEYVFDDEGNKIYEEKQVSTVDGRVFRHEFYGAFVRRMRGRLWEIKKSTMREQGVEVEGSTMALAIRDKEEEVKNAYDERAKVVRRSYESAAETQRGFDHTGEGRKAGIKAAETVPVTEGRGVKK